MRIMANEQGKNPEGTQSVVESMMNRAIVRGTSLEQQARWYRRERGGYYEMGNMGRGALENPWHRAILEQGLRNALDGSNISDYATDNSSGGLAYRERMTGKFRFRKGYHGESFFAPGWGEPGFARRWDQWHRQVEEAEQHGNGVARLTDHIRKKGSLLKNAKTSGLFGPAEHKVTGDASLRIALDGFPKGTRTKASADGLFKEVTVNRGRSMGLASQDS